MQKDVIYIDVEDDITAIIGKVKTGKEKIVALVPPKRIGVLQSAVNLRLLERAATQNDKKLVIITGNQALQSLAASAKIPVAKTLQSKPELAEISALDIDDGNDIIDGAQLPVGDHARMANEQFGSTTPADEKPDATPTQKAAPIATTSTATKNIASKKPKVPNFSRFRKKLLIGGLAGLLLLGFLVWAIIFAPHATIYITAKTADANANDAVTLAPGGATSAAKKTIRSLVKSGKKDISFEFSATGKKEVGEKATGTVMFSTDSISVARRGTTIPAGTELTASGNLIYVTSRSVSLTLTNPNGTTGVTAEERGTKYNGASGEVDGAPQGVAAEFTDATGGGTDKTVAVVTSRDIADAQRRLDDQIDGEALKQELAGQFDDNVTVLSGSFKVDKGGVNPSPGQGGEVESGKARMSGTVSYSLAGVANGETESYLEAYFKNQIKSSEDQRVYDSGARSAKFNDVAVDGNAVKANLVATGKVGPRIDDNELKKEAAGKRYGDIQSSLQGIQGVDSVDVKFSPFWVNQVPDDPKRVSIEFKLDGAN